jgi:hypothetical protein
MADSTHQASSERADAAESLATTEDTSKWKPYWDEQYKRYYWSDGNESVSRPPIIILL